MNKALKISGQHGEYQDERGDLFGIDIASNGRTTITVRNGPRDGSVELSNRAVHELRDMLNRRFPNATAVQ
jgi:hypothetical protein